MSNLYVFCHGVVIIPPDTLFLLIIDVMENDLRRSLVQLISHRRRWHIVVLGGGLSRRGTHLVIQLGALEYLALVVVFGD